MWVTCFLAYRTVNASRSQTIRRPHRHPSLWLKTTIVTTTAHNRCVVRIPVAYHKRIIIEQCNFTYFFKLSFANESVAKQRSIYTSQLGQNDSYKFSKSPPKYWTSQRNEVMYLARKNCLPFCTDSCYMGIWTHDLSERPAVRVPRIFCRTKSDLEA